VIRFGNVHRDGSQSKFAASGAAAGELSRRAWPGAEAHPANLSKLPGDLIGGLRALLKGGTVIGTGPDEIQIERSLPHGHVAAALGTIRKIALDRLILSTTKDEASRRHCDLVVAMIVDRLIAPRSKLGFCAGGGSETAVSSLGSALRLGKVKEREAYEALDWLVERQARIETGLARRHLQDGVLVLYDVSSSYFEGRCCPLAHYGHSRDHRGDRPADCLRAALYA